MDILDNDLGDTSLGDAELDDTDLGDAELDDTDLGDADLGDADLGVTDSIGNDLSVEGTGNTFSDAELRSRLTPEQYQVTQRAGTERPFSGEYWDCHDEGKYRCIVCDATLFMSNTKYESGTGWPSFFEAASPGVVRIQSDRSHGMIREEAVCANCDAHLGHRFEDGPSPTQHRYCMNSASLRLDRD